MLAQSVGECATLVLFRANAMSVKHAQHEAMRHALLKRLAWQGRLNDPAATPEHVRSWLSKVRHWQSVRLHGSFEDLLKAPDTRAAATFFLEDLYGDRDFSARDRDLAKLLPLMSRLLPTPVLSAAVQAVELNVLSQAFDLKLAAWLAENLQPDQSLTLDSYGRAYRAADCRRLRGHQIDLIVEVGQHLDWAVHKHGVERLLKLSRGPAKIAGLGELQSFLERGFSAFRELGGADAFLARIADQEREVSRRLFANHARPFPPFDDR
jgi:hypothetical protein